jgi:hypothetical protein
MMQKLIKVGTSGNLACYLGKEQLHRVWEEIPIPPGQSRAAIRAKVDPVLLCATRMLFGPHFKPADFNEVHQRRALVKQIMADSPRLLVPIFAFVVNIRLSPTPHKTVIRRFKMMLQREGAQDFKLSGNGGCYLGLDSKGRKRKENDVNRFWGSYRDFERPGLSEAGWRYLQKLSVTTQRQLAVAPWQWSNRYLHTFSLLGHYGIPTLDRKAIEFLDMALAHCIDEDSKQYFARAAADRFSRVDDPVTELEIDTIRDWLYEEKRTIHPGTRWETISERAFTFSGDKADKTRKEMANYQWQPPIEPFVADDGITVIPLSTGIELLQEGLEMDNCLRNQDSYAKRAIAGVSQVFSIRGVQGRATVEFARKATTDPWYLAQLEGPEAASVDNPVIHRVVEKIQANLEGNA